jgi:hypothetical protein
MKKIPSTVQTYTEGSVEPQVKKDEHLIYEPNKGEVIDVTLWVQYPSYDFIFGVPAEGNPKYEKEYGFFCFRKRKDGETESYWSVYVDQTELEEMQKGWVEVTAMSRITRQKEWREHDARGNG